MKKSYSIKNIIPGIVGKLGMIVISLVLLGLIFNGAYLFILFLPFPVISITAYRGVELDLEKHEYSSFLSLAGFKMGDRLPLPEIEYLVIREAFFVTSQYRDTKTYDDTYEVALICKGHLKIPLFYSYDEKEIVEFARKEKFFFKCPVEDATKEKIAKAVIH